MDKKKNKYLIGSCIIVGLILIGVIFLKITDITKSKLRASTIIDNGDFWLQVENSWDNSDKKNYADISWEKVPNLNKGGYVLRQSEDSGVTWNKRSMNYGKTIKVLNIYPDLPASNTLKGWMNKQGIGWENKNGKRVDYVSVTAVKISDYNKDPKKYLMDKNENYLYDVLMFGTWDSNNNLDLSKSAGDVSEEFLNSGRGILLGHDTVRTTSAGAGTHTNFNRFAKYLGTNVNRLYNSSTFTGSAKVKIKNDGYMMKFPHELPNNAELTIPATHVVNYIDPTVSSIWMDFVGPPWQTFNVGPTTEGKYISNYYLATTENIGQIQTGHSNGASTDNEMRILVNTLYNLAQVTIDTIADDQSVKDDVAPLTPSVEKIEESTLNTLKLGIKSKDMGKKYQWYVEADTKKNGLKKSDRVEEEIKSEMAGYIYELNESPDRVPNVERDEYGHVMNINLSVSPSESEKELVINPIENENNYLHIVAVDRAHNVSEARHIKIIDLMDVFEITDKLYLKYRTSHVSHQDYEETYVTSVKKGSSYGLDLEYMYSSDGQLTKIETESQTINRPYTKNQVIIDKVMKSQTIKYYHTFHVTLFVNLNVEEIPDWQPGDLRNSVGFFLLRGLEGERMNLAQNPQIKSVKSLIENHVTHNGYTFELVEKPLNETDYLLKVVGDIGSWSIDYYYRAVSPENNRWLNIVNENKSLVIHYKNLDKIRVKIDGEYYKEYKVSKTATKQQIVLEIPVNGLRNVVVAEGFDNDKEESVLTSVFNIEKMPR